MGIPFTNNDETVRRENNKAVTLLLLEYPTLKSDRKWKGERVTEQS